MRTELIGVRLPPNDAARVRSQAAERGITASRHALHLVLRGLDTEAQQQLPSAVDRLERVAGLLSELYRSTQARHESEQARMQNGLHLEQRAFMIEVLTLLRYLFKDDLKIKSDVGRRLQKSVGEVRVEGL